MGVENERFKAIRESLSMTQEQFAEKFNLSVASVRKIENAGANLGVNHARKIHELFGYSLDYIYGLIDSTNDEASTMLLYLKELFHYRFDNTIRDYPHTVIVKPPVIDFLNAVAKADELLKSGMPQQAYDLWIGKLKADFNAAMNENAEYLNPPKFRLVPADKFKVETRGADVAHPPYNIG